MRQNPKPQEIYRHFKGNVYQIITLARHSESNIKMVVYQQLYAPFEVYVRPLDMFMSKIDTKKYPNEKQIYRFEKIDLRGEDKQEKGQESTTETLSRILSRGKKGNEDAAASKTTDVIQEEEFELDPGLVEFLDADSYEKKLEILGKLHNRITDDMIDTMAVSLDTEVKDGDIEMRYAEIRNCLLMMERFECNRLR